MDELPTAAMVKEYWLPATIRAAQPQLRCRTSI
jgi:hypothetical protein